MLKALILVLLCASTAAAQEFAQGPIADPREPRIAIGFLRSTLFADELQERPGQGLGERREWDTHGVIQLGITRRVLRLGAISAGIQGGAISRFRLDASDNDALTVDYMVAMPVTFDLAGTQTRVRLIHRSAHLGDEVVLNEGLRRLEFDHEEVDFTLRRGFGQGITGYISGALTLASSFVWDDGGLQAGVEGKWEAGWLGRWSWGVDWQRHGISDWTDQFNGVFGVERQILGWSGRLQARFHSGATHLGEFFRDREKAWGAEVILGW